MFTTVIALAVTAITFAKMKQAAWQAEHSFPPRPQACVRLPSGFFALEDLMTNWRQSEPKVWHWRVRGRSSDSQVVTLGKYDTESEARADQDRIVKDGFYRNVRIEQIRPLAQQ